MEYRFTDKCVGCYLLRRKELDIGLSRTFKDRRKTSEGKLVIYDCMEGLYPYQAAISGLLHPSVGINTAARDCPKIIEGHCILCSETERLITYGREPILAYICSQHNSAWSAWLNERAEKRKYLAPRGRSVRSNWIEVFREFIEDMRCQLEGEP